jgi:hypothetical protein
MSKFQCCRNAWPDKCQVCNIKIISDYNIQVLQEIFTSKKTPENWTEYQEEKCKHEYERTRQDYSGYGNL